jgi:uncharacterized protein YbjT (DUF2867 family)
MFYRVGTRPTNPPGLPGGGRRSRLAAMPVLITGVEDALGRAVVRALVRAGGEVRVFVDDSELAPADLTAVRGAGCKVARGTLDDEALLELALEQVHTVVHAAAGVLLDPGELLDGLASVTSAALGAGCQRLVWLSHLGADLPAGNPWLEACADGEALLAEAPIDTVVIRRALTYGVGDALTGVLADSTGGASPDALHAPLFLQDLAAAVVAADNRDRADGTLAHLVVPLGGPRQASLGELVALLGGQVRSGGAGGPLPFHAADLLSRDLLPPAGSPAAGTAPEAGTAAVRAALGVD